VKGPGEERRERESVCLFVSSPNVCVCVFERERESESEREKVLESIYQEKKEKPKETNFLKKS